MNPRRFVRSPAMPGTNRDRALRLIEKKGLTRPRDLEAHGITRAQLSRLVDEGRVGGRSDTEPVSWPDPRASAKPRDLRCSLGDNEFV